VAAPDGTEFQHACEVSRFPNHSGSDEGNTQMNEHRAEGRISIHQLLGKICICLPDQKVNMAVGQLLVLDCGMVHNVEALEESAFLLTGAIHGKQLHPLRGVRRWSAEYVSLRGLGRLQVFPGDDVGAQNKLQRYLDLKKTPNHDTVRRSTRSMGRLCRTDLRSSFAA
jgi:hypothetical protein